MVSYRTTCACKNVINPILLQVCHLQIHVRSAVINASDSKYRYMFVKVKQCSHFRCHWPYLHTKQVQSRSALIDCPLEWTVNCFTLFLKLTIWQITDYFSATIQIHSANLSSCSCVVEASMFTTFASFPSRCSVMPPPHLICPDVHPSMHYKHFLHCYLSGLPHLSVFGFIVFPIEDCNLLTFSPSNFYSIYDSHCVFCL